MTTESIIRATARATANAPSPASPEVVAAAEDSLGFPLPSLLKALYLEVANGGFGPGYGVLGVAGGHRTDEGDAIDEFYAVLASRDPEDPVWDWPAGLLPFCHWGCAIYSCVDCNGDAGRVVWFDPNGREPGTEMAQYFIAHRESLASWFASWLEGVDLWAETYGAT